MKILRDKTLVREEFTELPVVSNSLDNLENVIKRWHHESKRHEGDEEFLGYKTVRDASMAFESELINYIKNIFKKLR
jgi:hypothetical protein